MRTDYEGFTELAHNPDAGDERLYVVFRVMAVENHAKSADAGRPIYEDKECIEVRIPGDKDNIIIREATERDKQRFHKHYRAFKDGQGELQIGTPLAAVPWMTRSQVEELAYFGVKTVEQLANLGDGTRAAGLGGIQGFKQRAKDFLAAAAGAAPAEKLRAELEQRDNEIALLKHQQDEMAAAIAELRKPAKTK